MASRSGTISLTINGKVLHTLTYHNRQHRNRIWRNWNASYNLPTPENSHIAAYITILKDAHPCN